ncbi:MAG: 30S ribosomal protein S3 [bacterium]|nr:30S ribosomal protein S3 [bacterium]
MGQKVHPYGFRLGSFFDWKAHWFAPKSDYADTLLQDLKLRRLINEQLDRADLVDLIIERSLKKIRFIFYVGRPGVVIGRGGSGIERLKEAIYQSLGVDPKAKNATQINIEVKEVKNPDLSARIVLKRIIAGLKKRIPHRRIINKAMEQVMASGAQGVKIIISGRIGGTEISRTEKYSLGKIPTQTLRANIDYAEEPALTRSGYVGVKVYIYKGEISKK